MKKFISFVLSLFIIFTTAFSLASCSSDKGNAKKDNSKISAPVKKDDVIGYLQITINGEVYKKLPIKCRETVKEFNIKYAVKVVLHKFLP